MIDICHNTGTNRDVLNTAAHQGGGVPHRVLPETQRQEAAGGAGCQDRGCADPEPEVRIVSSGFVQV